MQNSEQKAFDAIMCKTADSLGKPYPTKSKMTVFWDDLKEFTLPEVEHAFQVCRKKHHGYPAVADLVRVIRPPPPPPEKSAQGVPAHRPFADSSQKWTDQEHVDAQANFERWKKSPERRALLGGSDA